MDINYSFSTFSLIKARMILERHLVVADKAFSMADLRTMSNDTIVLPTIRDALTIRVREDGKRMW